MWQWVGSLLSSTITGVLTPLFGYLNKKQDVTLDGFKAALGSDQAGYQAYTDYLIKMETLRSSEVSWWGPKVCFMLVAAPACIHVGLVYVDSWSAGGLWMIGHIGVLKLPPDYFEFEKRVIEFLFGGALVGPPLSAATAWLHRKG